MRSRGSRASSEHKCNEKAKEGEACNRMLVMCRMRVHGELRLNACRAIGPEVEGMAI